MNSVLVAMAILGCSDSGDQCQTVRIEPAAYVSVAQCNAAAEATLTRYSGLSYPVIAVRCQKIAVPTLVSAGMQPNG